MTKEDSIKLLIQVASIAYDNGLLKLKDASLVAEAINVLDPQSEDIGGGVLVSPKPPKK